MLRNEGVEPWEGALVALTDGHESEIPFVKSLKGDLEEAHVSLHVISLDVTPPLELVDLVSNLRGQVLQRPLIHERRTWKHCR